MEQNTPKFHLRLNLFDGIVLLLALAVGGFLLWNSRSTASVPLASSATVRYTVRFLNWPEENVSRIREGGLLVDNVKKYEIGRVVSYEVEPAITLLLDHEDRQYVYAENAGHVDILVTVDAHCTDNGESLLAGGGYALQVGQVAYIKGEGYMASGPIVAIERGEQG